ncbi:MAG TPA: hypothetical protein VLJ20_01790 [Acetobacteraceae bacterium]|nr:hypothetical protein [Acetobacteraceae bacterium]
MATVALSPPTSLMPRFVLFINHIKLTIGGIVLWRHEVAPLILPLGHYLTGVQRRLAALHARFVAGKLPAAPRAPHPVSDRVAAERARAEPRPSGIPPGPVLLTVFRMGLDEMLQALLDDPEMRALLAAAPQAGRILRPLWRKLSPRPLPAVLRLPPRPRKPRPPRAKPPVVVRVKPARVAPTARPAGPPPLRLVDGQWEPTPCLPPFPD